MKSWKKHSIRYYSHEKNKNSFIQNLPRISHAEYMKSIPGTCPVTILCWQLPTIGFQKENLKCFHAKSGLKIVLQSPKCYLAEKGQFLSSSMITAREMCHLKLLWSTTSCDPSGWRLWVPSVDDGALSACTLLQTTLGDQWGSNYLGRPMRPDLTYELPSRFNEPAV